MSELDRLSMNMGIFIHMLESKEDQIIIGDPKIEISDVE